MILRPYQSQAIDKVRSFYSKGHRRVLIHSPTGTGKTVMFCWLLRETRNLGNRAIMVVKGIHLVEQACERLRREGVPFGVYQANHPDFNPDEPIQICSIDTLYRRQIAPKADLIVIDEADLASGESYRWLIGHYPKKFFLPVTATPYCKNGLRHVADHVVTAISTSEAIESGYLVGMDYFAPTDPDLSSVRIDTKKGDYQTADLEKIMGDKHILGNVIHSYRENGFPLPCLVFAVSIAHSKSLAEKFNADGIPAVHADKDTSLEERLKYLNQLKTGEIKVLCNVGIMCRGVDIPWLQCISMARPTRSYNLYIQQLGRGSRPHDGKKSCLVLDHAGNVYRHGMFETHRPAILDGIKSIDRSKPSNLSTCAECFAIFKNTLDSCPVCGSERVRKPREIREGKGKLSRLNKKKLKPMPSPEVFDSKVLSLCHTAIAKNYKAGWVYFMIKSSYGPHAAKASWRKIKSILSAQSVG